MLAFRAAFSGVAATEVLGIVDPLAASAPLRDCALRDVDQAAGAMVTRGDAIELEELGGDLARQVEIRVRVPDERAEFL